MAGKVAPILVPRDDLRGGTRDGSRAFRKARSPSEVPTTGRKTHPRKLASISPSKGLKCGRGRATSAAHRHARKEQEKARERIQTRNRVEKTFRTKLRQELKTKNSHSEFWTKISCKTFPAEVAEKVREILGPSVPSAANAGRSARVPRKNAEQIPGGGHRPTRPPGKNGQHFP